MKKENRPLVTIVTVTFNLIKAGRKDFFCQCLESVHSQVYENIEHIIIDGGSTDGTFELIEEYAKKDWISFVSEPDNGIYSAMNKGVKMAKGKYIAFLNSDDFYHNIDAVKLSVEALEKNNADFSYADFISINENEKEIIKGEIENFLYTMPFGHPTMFVRTSVIRNENGFNENYGLPADYDLVIRLILKDYKSVYVNSQIVSYRVGGLGSTTDHSAEIAKIYYNNYSVFQKFSNIAQAKKIMYELKLPYGFISNFRSHTIAFENINIDKIVSKLVNNLTECKEKNDIDDLKNKKEGIPVFLSSDDNYAPFVATTICSVMDNTKSFINFYILDGGISVQNVEKIKDIKKIFSNFSVEFIEIDTKKEFADFPTRLHFSVDMYTRFLIPKLRPNLKKVIYSDVDVIFNGDIKSLLDEDLEGRIIGAVPYSFGYLSPDKSEINSYHKRLCLSSNHEYFESGLLLINIESWNKDNITEKLIDEVKNNPSDVILTPDQDVLNMVFDNDYKKLDNKYIVVPHRQVIMQTDIVTRKSIEKPFIIHYAGSNKPWKNPGMNMADYFWKYARITPFYEEMLFNLQHLRAQDKSHEEKAFDGKITKKSELLEKIFFVVFSPIKFVRKYCNILLNGKLRQPARKTWYYIRGKKI